MAALTAPAGRWDPVLRRKPKSTASVLGGKQKKVARTAVALLQHNWPHPPLPHRERKRTELSGLGDHRTEASQAVFSAYRILIPETNYSLPFSAFIKNVL